MDEDLIPTPVLEPVAVPPQAPPGDSLPPLPPTGGVAAGESMAAVDRDLQIVLNFAEYQDVYAEWVSDRLSSSEVLRLHGRSVLDLVQSQWAFAAGDTLEAESRAAALGGPSGGGGEVDGTLPDSQELVRRGGDFCGCTS